MLFKERLLMQNIAKTRNDPGLQTVMNLPCPAGSGQEVGGCSVNDFLAFSSKLPLIICLGVV